MRLPACGGHQLAKRGAVLARLAAFFESGRGALAAFFAFVAAGLAFLATFLALGAVFGWLAFLRAGGLPGATCAPCGATGAVVVFSVVMLFSPMAAAVAATAQ